MKVFTLKSLWVPHLVHLESDFIDFSLIMFTFSWFFVYWVTLHCSLDAIHIKLWRFCICCSSLMTIVSFGSADTFLGLTWIGNFLSLAVVAVPAEPCMVLGIEFGDPLSGSFLARQVCLQCRQHLSSWKTVETGTHLSEWTWTSRLNPCTSLHSSVPAAGCCFVSCLGFRVIFYRKVVCRVLSPIYPESKL